MASESDLKSYIMRKHVHISYFFYKIHFIRICGFMDMWDNDFSTLVDKQFVI